MNFLLVLAMPFLPQATGGTQSSTHELAIGLLKAGHDVTVMAGLSPEGFVGLRSRIALRLSRLKMSRERSSSGYTVLRKWHVWEGVPEIVRAIRPDRVLVQQCPKMTVPTTRAFLDCGLPTAVYLRDVEFHQLDGDLATIKDAIFIANSQFTANRYAEAFGISASIVPPMFQREQYATARTGRQQYVTYINPHPLKGLDLALELTSQFPTTEFLFVESWGIASPEDRKQLRDRIVSRLNVTLVPPTQNMRSIYAKTDILLMPSRWEEAWGRVVSEAQFSGIPVIASKVGGLPESVGPGGILIDPSEPLDTWCRALDQLIKDDSFYANLSQAALRYSARPEIDGVHQVQQVLDLVAGDTLQRACRKLVPLTRP